MFEWFVHSTKTAETLTPTFSQLVQMWLVDRLIGAKVLIQAPRHESRPELQPTRVLIVNWDAAAFDNLSTSVHCSSNSSSNSRIFFFPSA